jgi:hypothetical protein
VDTDGTGEAVVSVVTVLLNGLQSEALLDRAVDVLREESVDLPGFLGGDALLSTDAKTLAIVTEWRDIHAWSASRYDMKVGQLLEEFLNSSTVLGFEVYHRKARIVPNCALPRAV